MAKQKTKKKREHLLILPWATMLVSALILIFVIVSLGYMWYYSAILAPMSFIAQDQVELQEQIEKMPEKMKFPPFVEEEGYRYSERGPHKESGSAIVFNGYRYVILDKTEKGSNTYWEGDKVLIRIDQKTGEKQFIAELPNVSKDCSSFGITGWCEIDDYYFRVFPNYIYLNVTEEELTSLVPYYLNAYVYDVNKKALKEVNEPVLYYYGDEMIHDYIGLNESIGPLVPEGSYAGIYSNDGRYYVYYKYLPTHKASLKVLDADENETSTIFEFPAGQVLHRVVEPHRAGISYLVEKDALKIIGDKVEFKVYSDCKLSGNVQCEKELIETKTIKFK